MLQVTTVVRGLRSGNLKVCCVDVTPASTWHNRTRSEIPYINVISQPRTIDIFCVFQQLQGLILFI